MFHFRIRPPGGNRLSLSGRAGLSGPSIGSLFTKALGSVTLAIRGLSTVSTSQISYQTTAPVIPVWSFAPTFTIAAGVQRTEPVPVSAPGYPITLTWVGPGSLTSYPWITLNSGLNPSITFTGTQVDANDVTGLLIDATANGTTVRCPVGGSITVTPQTTVWRQIQINTSLTPFNSYTYGSKHVMLTWHPFKKRVYQWGGDYGTGSTAFNSGTVNDSTRLKNYDPGQIGLTNDPVSPISHQWDDSLRNDMYSMNPYAANPNPWRLEHPMLPRHMGGNARESVPGRPDQVSLVWDELRFCFWGIYTAVRYSEFGHNTDGTKGNNGNGISDPWANGDLINPGSGYEPSGTWKWIPSQSGGAGTWTLATAARCVYRSGQSVGYTGNVLWSGHMDERCGYWERDATNDKVYGSGFTRLFIFDPAKVPTSDTDVYQHRSFFPSGFSYFNASTSQLAILDDYLYGVAFVRWTSYSDRRSVLWRVRISSMLGLQNGGTITDYDVYQLPFSLSMYQGRDNYWELYGDYDPVLAPEPPYSAKWEEHAGVLQVDGRIVIVGSYDGVVIPGGSTKIALFDPRTQSFSSGFSCPDPNVAAGSWVALPDTNEVMFGITTATPAAGGNADNTKMWAFKVSGSGPLTPLEQLAVGMAPGDWREITNSIGFTNILKPNGGGEVASDTILEFSDKLVHDPKTRRVYFIGCSRWAAGGGSYDGGTTAGSSAGYIVYDIPTNTWSRMPTAPIYCASHANEHFALDRQTGDMYYMESGEKKDTEGPPLVWKGTKNGTVWTSSAYPSAPGFSRAGSNANTCEWFPELGALVHIWGGSGYLGGGASSYPPSLFYRRRGSSSWTEMTITAAIGRYSSFMRYSLKHQCLYFGGGATGDSYWGGNGNVLCKVTVDSSGNPVITNLGTPPIYVGDGGGGGRQCIDPVTGNLLAFTNPNPGQPGTGRVWSYNGTTWAQHAYHPLGDYGQQMINVFTDLPGPGLVLAVNSYPDKIYIYKHA